MNADTINKVRVQVSKAVEDQGGLELIWDVAPTEAKKEMFCTAVIRDGGRRMIATCGNAYDYREDGTVEITAYMKRGQGDKYLRDAVDEIKYFLEESIIENVTFGDIPQDVPLEAEQTQYAIFLQVEFFALTSRPITQG